MASSHAPLSRSSSGSRSSTPTATEPLDTTVAIETPEHIVFRYRIAGPARRALGHALDLFFCYAALAVLAVIVLIAAGLGDLSNGEIGQGMKAGMGLILLAMFVAQWVWFVVWEAVYGRSPGKRIVGVRVVTTSGRPIGWRAAALRNLLRAADVLPTGYVVGVLSMALSPRFQRLGDLVAGTMVIVPELPVAAKALELWPPVHPSELATLPERVTLDAEERVAIEMFLRRRHSLGPAREHELAEMLAPKIAKRLGFMHRDKSRLLAIVYDRAVSSGRTEAPPSSWHPRPKAERRP